MNSQKPIERASGGLVVRRSSQGPEILLIEDAYGHVAFPKGHLEAGETWEDAAVREIFEETQVQAHIIAPLGRVEYTINRSGSAVSKQVRLYLLEVVDETSEPVYQQEEVKGAYFLPWAEAIELHKAKGYRNWDWIFNKAKSLLDWHNGHWETEWRQLKASTPTESLHQVWNQVEPLVQGLLSSVMEELKATAPEIYGRLPETKHTSLPVAVPDLKSALYGAIEHTLLKPEASAVDILNLCGEAIAHGFRAVCVNPQHVRSVAESVKGTSVIPCTVIGFPLGAADPVALVAETGAVIDNGATEVDMVIPVGAMREDDIWTVFEHVQAVCNAAKERPGVKVKVILECHFLTYDQVAKASYAALAAGADFLKTSTGFAPSGAKIADVALMAKISGVSYGVKAAGGIRSRLDAVNYLHFGANRIGTSSGALIVRE